VNQLIFRKVLQIILLLAAICVGTAETSYTLWVLMFALGFIIMYWIITTCCLTQKTTNSTIRMDITNHGHTIHTYGSTDATAGETRAMLQP
jgi:hypothetical protein